MDRITAVAKANELLLIEDNAHGLFSTFRGRNLGTFGSFATLSFHETKNITCGEGGALVINDSLYAERAEILREKGTNRGQFLRGQVDKYTWVDVGSSWVLSDILAAVLNGQLGRADEINHARLSIWNNYQTELQDWASEHAIRIPVVPEGSSHVGHLYHMRFASSDHRSNFIVHMKSHGIECVFHYQPLHLSPVGRRFGGFHGQCPVSEDAGDCLVRLPIFGGMTESQQLRVIEAVRKFTP
jgi:dTDP-4-amino-4,6-dideoxygalactose transaminase